MISKNWKKKPKQAQLLAVFRRRFGGFVSTRANFASTLPNTRVRRSKTSSYRRSSPRGRSWRRV